MADEIIQVVQTLLNHINSMEGLPATVELEFLQEDPPAMMLQQLAGSNKIEEDIVGNYTAHFPFALYVRTYGTTNSDRVDATKVLNEIGAAFDLQTIAGTLPDLGSGKSITSIAMTSCPSLADRNEDIEDYQAIYRLEYQQIYEV